MKDCRTITVVPIFKEMQIATVTTKSMKKTPRIDFSPQIVVKKIQMCMICEYFQLNVINKPNESINLQLLQKTFHKLCKKAKSYYLKFLQYDK